MGRALGIAYASRLYRHNPALADSTPFSKAGKEISFATIGNASTSEGHFWETLNAAAVLQVPLFISIWDDEYGISVPARYQTAKENLSSLLSGFQTEPGRPGIKLYTLRGWDYPALCAAYQEAAGEMRKTHMPVVFHITELTQPQGHSTSGSHERYKTTERLEWELQHDGITKMRAWMLGAGIASDTEITEMEKEGLLYTKAEQRAAYQEFRQEIDEMATSTVSALTELALRSPQISDAVNPHSQALQSNKEPLRRDLVSALRAALLAARHYPGAGRDRVQKLLKEYSEQHQKLFGSHLYSQSAYSTQNHRAVPAVYSEQSASANGYEVLNMAFSDILRREPAFFAIGEDVGKIGDVNQGFAGLQELYGENRVTDTGIREMSIVGQGMGAAMRGLRPLAEIQYLDYLLYALQILSDDVATLHYRTAGGQKAPLIVRTRGHRLEGIWHSGSPMGMILHSIRGILLLVPRNMVQAVGFYNMLLACDEPAVVIESLNGYRLKERVPDNLFEFTLAPGVPEVLRTGTDISVITYGSCCRMALEAAERLMGMGIDAEVIDIQSLIPFDTGHLLLESIRKTNRFIIVDEDVPGGASSYIYQQIMEVQNVYFHLDSPGRTLTAHEHRPAYGSDGDYFSKPSVDDMVEAVYMIMSESDPGSFPPVC
jgi:pyruvate/2-oxoglutarate/acetoin dehydrogenase E1 component